MAFLKNIPVWYWILGLAVSLYQAYRGYRFQRIFAEEQNKEAGQENSTRKAFAHRWSDFEIVVLRAASDAIFYFVCAATGFLAVFLLYYIGSSLPSLHQIDGGTSAVLIFLALFGLLGVTGQLPHLLQQGKLPR